MSRSYGESFKDLFIPDVPKGPWIILNMWLGLWGANIFTSYFYTLFHTFLKKSIKGTGSIIRISVTAAQGSLLTSSGPFSSCFLSPRHCGLAVTHCTGDLWNNRPILSPAPLPQGRSPRSITPGHTLVSPRPVFRALREDKLIDSSMAKSGMLLLLLLAQFVTSALLIDVSQIQGMFLWPVCWLN